MAKTLFILSVVSYLIYRFLLRKQLKEQRAKEINLAISKFNAHLVNARKMDKSIHSRYFLDKVLYGDLAIEGGKGELLLEIEYILKYLYSCPNCGEITDVKESESYHRNTMESIMTHGRYTKDGDLDMRYNTEYHYVYTYFFDSLCTHCKERFTIEMNENEYENRNKLLSDS